MQESTVQESTIYDNTTLIQSDNIDDVSILYSRGRKTHKRPTDIENMLTPCGRVDQKFNVSLRFTSLLLAYISRLRMRSMSRAKIDAAPFLAAISNSGRQ